MNVKIKRLHDNATIPKYQTKGAAGFDLCSVEKGIMYPGETRIIKTGLSIEVPEGFELQIRSRSGLAAKGQIHVLNSPGTIDSDYRGEIAIILTNDGWHEFPFTVGDRIAQGVIAPVFQADFEEVKELSTTERGEGGFGSTGK